MKSKVKLIISILGLGLGVSCSTVENSSTLEVDVGHFATNAISLKMDRQGEALQLSQPQSYVYSYSEPIPSFVEIKRFETLEIEVFRDPAKQVPLSIEVMFIEKSLKTYLWRKVNIVKEGWHTYRVPLEFLRPSEGRILFVDQISRIGFHLQQAGDIQIRSIRLLDENEGTFNHAPLQVIAETIYDGDLSNVRIYTDDEFEIITDAEELDIPLLVDHFRAVKAKLFELFPFFKDYPSATARVVVFKDQEMYRQSAKEFAALYNAVGGEITSDGFTVLGIALCAWSEQFKTLRPTYMHEMLHSYLSRSVGLQNGSTYAFIQEGIANYLQFCYFHPMEDLNKFVHQLLNDSSNRVSFQSLLSGNSFSTRQYVQALTLIAMFHEDPKYQGVLAELVPLFLENNSSQMLTILEPRLELTWEELEADWEAFCRERFPLPVDTADALAQ